MDIITLTLIASTVALVSLFVGIQLGWHLNYLDHKARGDRALEAAQEHYRKRRGR